MNFAETVKTEYEIGDIFDFTGITAKITYSDSSTTNVALNADNTKVSGFNSSVEGTQPITFEYSGTSVETKFSVLIKKSTKEYKKLIDDGFTLLANDDLDAGIQKFSEAYKSEANDETALYYALAELATISTEESVKDIIKNNFGITSYPSTLNALFSDEWVKRYRHTDYVWTYSLTETTSTYGYVRVSGTPTSYSGAVSLSYYIDEEGDVIDAWKKYNYPHLLNCTLDENGKYFVYYYDYYNNFSSEELTDVKVYDINYAERKKVLSDNLMIAPEFAVPEWLSATDAYKSTLFKTLQTSDTLAMLLFGNIIDLNPDGINELVDKVLVAFDGKFSNVKSLAASMSDNTVAVPYNIISTLGLQEILGDSTVYIGKVELNVLISALQILKATFQYLSSYDLSANILAIKDAIVDPTNMYKFLKEVDTGKFLTVRNSKAIEESKNTFVESIQTVQDSYNFIVSSESSYPTAVKEPLSYYGQVFYTAAEDLKNCIKEGKVFYIPANDPFENENPEWSADDSNAGFAVDLGKFFTAGYFTNIVEREADSKFKISGFTSFKQYSSDIPQSTEFEITDDFTKEKFEEIHTASIAAAKEKYPDGGFWVSTSAGYKINYRLITDMFPKIPGLKEGEGYIVPIYSQSDNFN